MKVEEEEDGKMMVLELLLSDPQAAAVYVLWASCQRKMTEVPAEEPVLAAAAEGRGLGEEWRRYEIRRSLNLSPSDI